MNRAAGVCSLVLGLGFGLPGVYGAWYYARQGQVWTFLGFPTYGDGPFERWGFPTNVALLVSFVAVCAAEAAVGVLLWGGSTIAHVAGVGPAAGRAPVLDRVRAAVRTAPGIGAHHAGRRHPAGLGHGGHGLSNHIEAFLEQMLRHHERR